MNSGGLAYILVNHRIFGSFKPALAPPWQGLADQQKGERIPKRFMARTLARITNLGEVAQIQGAQVLNDVLIKGEGGLPSSPTGSMETSRAP